MDMGGNPNAPRNPYSPTRTGQALPGQTNNPQSYAQQRTAGQTAPQPNTYGYGGGTNTTGYGMVRSGGVQMPAPLTPSIPTPVPQPPVYNNPANPQTIANMWWLPQNQMTNANGIYTAPDGTVYNANAVPGGNNTTQPYQFANGNIGHAIPAGMMATPGSGVAYQPGPGSFANLQQMIGNLGGGGHFGNWTGERFGY